MKTLSCSLLGIILLLLESTFAEEAATFYVAPDGNDSWSGRLPAPSADGKDGPFRSVSRARDAIRQARGDASTPERYAVQLRGGTYYLSEPFVLQPEDSGTHKAPITYSAYLDERPILSGGRLIEGWREGAGRLWVAEVPDVKAGKWYFHQLFVNGERRTRARQPNEGYQRTAGPLPEIKDQRKDRSNPAALLGFTYRDDDIRHWRNLDDINVVLYYDWSTSRHWIKGLDEAARTVRFTNSSSWPVCYWERDQRYHLENFKEALDQPGEWYLDRRTGALHYWPIPGEDPTTATIVAPALEHIVELRGDPEKKRFVEYVDLKGLSFQHVAWRHGRAEQAQAQAAVYLTGAFFAQGARYCNIESCEVTRVGEYGLWLERGCQHNRIFHCELHDLGGGGVRVGESGPRDDEDLRAHHNTIDNCFIHDGGHVFPDGVGVWIGQSGYNRVSHNEISDMVYSGVSAGWSWGYGRSLANHNVIEWNHIHHLGFGVLSELSAIYTLGVSPGTVIRDNLLHDTYDYKYGSWGIGLDEGTSETLVENNVIYNHGHGIGLHYGHDNVVRNNVIAFCRQEMIGVGRVEEHLSIDFNHNICYGDGGVVASGNWGKAKMKSDYNCYWDANAGADLDFGDWEFDEWRDLGYDRNSVVADPAFVDPARHDFRLREGSPALELGVRQIDLSGVGLYGDREWVEAPSKIKRAPMEAAYRKRAKPVLKGFHEDFEGTPVGDLAKGASTSGEEKGAAIRVTEETAASGKRSLKFTDAPGLQHIWQPHLYYRPKLRRGTARLSFDVRLEKGSVLVHQWRDWRGSPFQIGPTLRFAADGKLLANDARIICEVPAGKWSHVEIVCPLGRAPHRTYTVTVTTEGRAPVQIESLPLMSEKFRQLNWVGFISEANESAAFYLDNISLESSPPDGKRK